MRLAATLLRFASLLSLVVASFKEPHLDGLGRTFVSSITAPHPPAAGGSPPPSPALSRSSSVDSSDPLRPPSHDAAPSVPVSFTQVLAQQQARLDQRPQQGPHTFDILYDTPVAQTRVPPQFIWRSLQGQRHRSQPLPPPPPPPPPAPHDAPEDKPSPSLEPPWRIGAVLDRLPDVASYQRAPASPRPRAAPSHGSATTRPPTAGPRATEPRAGARRDSSHDGRPWRSRWHHSVLRPGAGPAGPDRRRPPTVEPPDERERAAAQVSAHRQWLQQRRAWRATVARARDEDRQQERARARERDPPQGSASGPSRGPERAGARPNRGGRPARSGSASGPESGARRARGGGHRVVDSPRPRNARTRERRRRRHGRCGRCFLARPRTASQSQSETDLGPPPGMADARMQSRPP